MLVLWLVPMHVLLLVRILILHFAIDGSYYGFCRPRPSCKAAKTVNSKKTAALLLMLPPRGGDRVKLSSSFLYLLLLLVLLMGVTSQV